jgi:lipid-A-disaccharide synthase
MTKKNATHRDAASPPSASGAPRRAPAPGFEKRVPTTATTAAHDGTKDARSGDAPDMDAALVQSDSGRRGRAVLFTAFEPSGDAHAAPVIAELKRRDPNLIVYAWGGPKMEAAGATIISSTCDDGAMGLEGFKKVFSVRQEIQKLKRWATQHRVLVHVPVDSPAANFPICLHLKSKGVRVAHLVAPQIWAWGRWRLKKLRRATDVLMCLLPFEEAWFRERRIPAKFIGHPVVNRELDTAAIAERQKTLPQGSPRILLLPGSRSGEVRANLALLVRSYIELADRNRGTAGLIVAANERLAKLVRGTLGEMPIGLHMIVGDIDAAIHWADLALTVSGTVSLDLTRQHRPMVGVYRTGLLSYFGAKFMLKTPYRLLPNVIASREIVPEFVPAPPWISPKSIVEAATRFLKDSKNMAIASEELRRVALRFHGRTPDASAADIVLRLLDGRPIEDRKEHAQSELDETTPTGAAGATGPTGPMGTTEPVVTTARAPDRATRRFTDGLDARNGAGDSDRR